MAALALPDTNAGLGDVLLTLANLYQIYEKLDDEDKSVHLVVQASINKRWNAADQDVFILGVFLDPAIQASLFRQGSGFTHALPAGLNECLQRVWKQLYRLAPDTPENYDLHLACSDYYFHRAEFSDSMLNTAAFERRAQEKVSKLSLKSCYLLNGIQFTGQSSLACGGVEGD